MIGVMVWRKQIGGIVEIFGSTVKKETAKYNPTKNTVHCVAIKLP